MHDDDPAELYLPAEHCAGVAEEEPAAHTNPAAHGPVHVEVVRPAVEPYCPAGQSVQDPEPAREYLPAGQMAAVPLEDPAAHAYPAVHAPTHWAVVWATVPYRPAVHWPVQVDAVSPAVEP